MREIYAGLPADWRVFLEHKLYEPALYSTVISDVVLVKLLGAAEAVGSSHYCQSGPIHLTDYAVYGIDRVWHRTGRS